MTTGVRDIVLGPIYLLFGLALSAVAILILAAILFAILFLGATLVVPAMAEYAPEPKGYLAMLFAAVVFGPIGVVLLYFGAKLVRLGIRLLRPAGVALEELEPGIHEMNTGVYLYRSLGSRINPFIVHTMFFFATALVGVPAVMMVQQGSEEWHVLAGFIVMLAPIAGGWAYLWQQGRKFGKSTCRMRARHPRIGGVLDAEIEVEVPRKLAGLPPLPSGPVSVKLQYVTQKGTVVWQAEASVPVESIARPEDGTLRIPVRIAIPLDARKLSYGSWRLRLQAPYPAIDYASMFWPLNVLPPAEPPPAKLT